MERGAGGREAEAEPRVEIDDRGVVCRDGGLDALNARLLVPVDHPAPDPLAQALALPLAGDRGEVPVGAGVSSLLDDEEADDVDDDQAAEDEE